MRYHTRYAKRSTSHINVIVYDIWLHILQYLPIEDLANMQHISRFFNYSGHFGHSLMEAVLRFRNPTFLHTGISNMNMSTIDKLIYLERKCRGVKLVPIISHSSFDYRQDIIIRPEDIVVEIGRHKEFNQGITDNRVSRRHIEISVLKRKSTDCEIGVIRATGHIGVTIQRGYYHSKLATYSHGYTKTRFHLKRHEAALLYPGDLIHLVFDKHVHTVTAKSAKFKGTSCAYTVNFNT